MICSDLIHGYLCNRLQATCTLADVLSLITIERSGVAGRCFCLGLAMEFPTAKVFEVSKLCVCVF